MKSPISEYREVRYDADAKGCWPVTTELQPGIMNVLYVNGVPEMCEYLCPCGCGMPHPMFFQTGSRKRSPDLHLWDYSPGPTLTPSVRCLGGCKSHYNITGGKVLIHADSGQ